MSQRTFTATLFVVSDSAVLLHFNRKMSHWLPVGGKIKPGETPDEAAVREAREEAGLEPVFYCDRPALHVMDGNVIDLPRPMHILRTPLPDGTELVDYTYYAVSRVRDFTPYDASSQMRWVGYGELDTLPLRENIRRLAREAIERLS